MRFKQAEILAVGTELLLGDIVNTNAQFLAAELAGLGIGVLHQDVVGDNPERLAQALELALSRSDLVITSGGLGPTGDDITRETAARVLGLPRRLHQRSFDRMRSYFERSGRQMTDNNLKQAMLPEGCVVFDNDWGTAPGCAAERDGKTIVMLPGPPRELRPMFAEKVKPWLAQFSDGVIFSTSLRVFGIGEGAAESRLSDLMEGENPTLAPYAKDGEVLLRATARAETEEKARALCRPLVEEVRRRLGDYVYGENVDSLQQVVVETLKRRRLKIGLAESCTGGLIAQKITEIPGASEVFECGIVSYANHIKSYLLGVHEETLQKFGAVSPQTACQMAEGARLQAGADFGVAVTGLAGPGGGTPEKPVGLVFAALSDGQSCWVRRLTLGRSGRERNYIRHLTALNALDMARRYLGGLPQPADCTQTEVPVPNLSRSRGHGPGAAFGKRRIFSNRRSRKRFSPALPDNSSGSRVGRLFTGAPGAVRRFFTPESFRKMGLRLKKCFSPASMRAFGRRWVKNNIPQKGDSPRTIVFKTLYLACVAVFIVCLCLLIPYVTDYFHNLSVTNYAQSLYTPQQSNKRSSNGFLSEFERLYALNHDVRGWITIPDTHIDYPVVQSKDNDFYLRRDVTKVYNRHGVPFLDYRCTIQPFSQNTIIYGHNMKDTLMFHDLVKYEKASFYNESPVITFNTLYSNDKWKIFAAYITNATQAGGPIFNYLIPSFGNTADFESYISQLRLRSLIVTQVDVQPSDDILTLSTCTYEFPDARMVVVARRVRPGESLSVGEGVQNGQPLMPDIWYKKFGGTPPVTSVPSQFLSNSGLADSIASGAIGTLIPSVPSASHAVSSAASSKPASSSRAASKAASATSGKPASSSSKDSGSKVSSNEGSKPESSSATNSDDSSSSSSGDENQQPPEPGPDQEPAK